MKKIIELTGLNDLFEIIVCSKLDEKDNKMAVFDRFVKEYGEPIIYLGADRKASYDYCCAHDLNCVFANLEGEKDIEDVECVHDLEELRAKISEISWV